MTDQTSPYGRCPVCGEGNPHDLSGDKQAFKCLKCGHTWQPSAPPEPAVKLSEADFVVSGPMAWRLKICREFTKDEMLALIAMTETYDPKIKAELQYLRNTNAALRAERDALIALTNKQPSDEGTIMKKLPLEKQIDNDAMFERIAKGTSKSSSEHPPISKEELEKLKQEIEHIRKGECWAGYAISIRLGGENKLMTNTLPRLIAAVEQQDELVTKIEQLEVDCAEAEERGAQRNAECDKRFRSEHDALEKVTSLEAENASLAAQVKELEAFVQKVIDWPDHMNIYDMRKLARHLKQAGDRQ